MPTTWLTMLLLAAGVFTVVLGTLHLFLPAALDYRTALLERPADTKPPRAVRIPLTRYIVSLRDRYGIVWIMNHVASYALVSIGLVDLIGTAWLQTDGRLLALWIAGWWFIRAASQFYMGRRVGDGVILLVFAGLGVLHLVVALR